MSIADEAAKQAAVRAYMDQRRAMQDAVAKEYQRAGALLASLAALNANVAAWAQAEAGTAEAELYAMHRAVIPADADALIAAIATKAQELRAAIEAADLAAGGTWFGIVEAE